jgi:hypothetical protein
MFADLEAQVEALEVGQRAGEVDEHTRAELSGIGVLDRLRAAESAPLRVQTLGGAAFAGTLARVGAGWLLLDREAGQETVVQLSAVVRVDGLPRSAAVPGSMDKITARLGLASVLRRLARNRSPVRLYLTDGTTTHATIDRVGSDFLDAALHAPGEFRRPDAVRGTTLVRLDALAAVSRPAGVT